MSDRTAIKPTHGGRDLQVGDEFDVRAGKIAHGGHVVARIGDIVAFVRGALPGEGVRIRVSDVRPTFVRADAIEIHEPHPERRKPLCAVAGECGGCDFQHASQPLQRQLKLDVMSEALVRYGKLSQHRVDGLLAEGVVDLGMDTGWRSRMRYRVTAGAGDADANGHVLGMYRHRSALLVDASSCVIAEASGHRMAAETVRQLPLDSEIGFAVGEDGPVINNESDGDPRGSAAVRHRIRVQDETFEFHVPADGFWQVHPRLGQAIIDRLVEVARPQSGERWWDLYAGAGPISAAVGWCVGDLGRVDAVEASSIAVQQGRQALAAMPWVKWHRGDVRRWVSSRARPRRRSDRPAAVHGVVLDPPRAGAGARVLEPIVGCGPRVIVIVACDPVALGRDTAVLAELGYEPSTVRIWDAFPQTHHMEALATFLPRDQIS